MWNREKCQLIYLHYVTFLSNKLNRSREYTWISGHDHPHCGLVLAHTIQHMPRPCLGTVQKPFTTSTVDLATALCGRENAAVGMWPTSCCPESRAGACDSSRVSSLHLLLTCWSELYAPWWDQPPPWPSSAKPAYFQTLRISCNSQSAGTDYQRNEPRTGKPSSFLSSAHHCCPHCGLQQFPQPKGEVTIMVRSIIRYIVLHKTW